MRIENHIFKWNSRIISYENLKKIYVLEDFIIYEMNLFHVVQLSCKWQNFCL